MNVLFVSERDECRGPMARVISQLHARDLGVIGAGFDSAGIAVTRPAPCPPEVVSFLREQGLNVVKHRSRPIAAAQVRWADVILCMSHDIAERVRLMLGPQRAGMVVVLNDAVRFGRSAADRNILALEALSQRELLTTFTRIKAATGRMIRNMSHGEDRPTDYGAEVPSPEVKSAAGYLDDLHVRQFLSRYILEFIERAFEFPKSEDIIEALAVMGRPLSILDLEDLIRADLKDQVFQEDDGRWQIEAHVKEERARQRQERMDQQRRREAEAEQEQAHQEEETDERRRRRAEDEARWERQRGARKNPANGNGGGNDEDSGRITEAQALEVLTITLQTSREEAARKYKQLLMRFHPDKFHDDDEFRHMAERKTKRINLAWSVVKDKLPNGE